MRIYRLLVAALLLAATQATLAAKKPATQVLPPGVTLPKDVKLPWAASIGIYVPASAAKYAIVDAANGVNLQPGKALKDSVAGVAQNYFTDSFLVEPGNTKPWGLLVALRPKWGFERGDVTLTLKFKVFDAQGKVALEGEKTGAAPLGNFNVGTGYYRSATRAAQLALLDILLKLKPEPGNFPVAGSFRDLKPDLYVDRDAPVQTGTGFFINATGQMLTAAHVVHDCVLTEAARDDIKFDTRLIAASNLLDVAVMETGRPASRFLPLRLNAELNLGEPVANVGFPLQKILAASPNLTRGNVSSRGALAGAVGQFQFSAPVQPGSSGGPVVSDGGELLGVTVGTLNALALAERGVLPQNVNFALDSRYVAMFLRKNGIAFTEQAPNAKGDMKTGNEAALATVLRLTCYQ